MIKRTAAFFIIALYTITMAGVAVDLHYCCNQLVSIAVNAPAKQCGMTAFNTKCCKNTHLEIKVKDAHQVGSASSLCGVFCFEMPPRPLAAFFLFTGHPLPVNFDAHGPPGLSVRRFVKNCVFRI